MTPEDIAKMHEYMAKTFGNEWTSCLERGDCWIVQDTVYNPYADNGIDLVCKVHGSEFNIPTNRGDWHPDVPSKCPACGKDSLN